MHAEKKLILKICRIIIFFFTVILMIFFWLAKSECQTACSHALLAISQWFGKDAQVFNIQGIVIYHKVIQL